jgi:hypothetical protein
LALFVKENNMIYTADSVTAWHPDKICDQISDAIVDACLTQDKQSRVAVETMGGHGMVVLMGEVTTKANIDYAGIARKTFFDLIGKDIGVLTNIVKQSPDIAKEVVYGGAGDEGIMVGNASNDNSVNITMVNDPADTKTLMHLLKYDSVHRTFQLGFTIEGDVVTFENGKKIIFSHEKNPELIAWGENKIDIVIESSGLFLNIEL